MKASTESLVRNFYSAYRNKLQTTRERLQHPLTFAEKVLLAHLAPSESLRDYRRGEDYAGFCPDRVAMQDATAQMALLQFMTAGKDRTAVPASVHCDHLVVADKGAAADLPAASEKNHEVYDFLQSASERYGIDFWKPGSGIIHQVVLENYAFPGGMMTGTDSHTPNAGGLGMVAVGVGGADAVDVLTGQPWELKMPRITGVHLTGRLSGWASAKDVILKLLGMLTVKGGTNSIFEYFGPGVESLSATGRATICNMGAELGATCSLFPFDRRTADYLRATGREILARQAEEQADELRADAEVEARPEAFYDTVIELNLSDIEPSLNGPFSPDAATPVSQMPDRIREKEYPRTVEVALIGSCTNSSYEDLSRAASVLKQAVDQKIPVRAKCIINPGSEQIRRTAERDGLLDIFRACGATIMANACGPCIGQWRRTEQKEERKNTIVTSFNRNFRSRADGNPNTFAFVASPELTAALAIAGRLDFNPATDTLENADGTALRLAPPQGDDLPANGFSFSKEGLITSLGHPDVPIRIHPDSERLQKLVPFAPNHPTDFADMPLLIKVQGKCTTDHISQAGTWLRFRGHLQNISQNLLLGATNAFHPAKAGFTLDRSTGEYVSVATAATALKQTGHHSAIVAEDNYGEGSSREHAAMEPRYLGVGVVLAKSFARIHETNLKKQGLLALTFADPADYDRIREDDTLSIIGLDDFAPDSRLQAEVAHADGSKERFAVCHTYNNIQIGWFRAGSALNVLATQQNTSRQ